MSIQIYILSKLIEEDNYPYKLKKELSEPIPFDKMANLTESKLYYHFESLTKQGLIEPLEVIKEENRPDKQVFAITDKGREQLPEKIYQMFEKTNILAEMIVGLMFLRHVEQSRIIRILEEKVDYLRSKQSRYKEIYGQVRVDDNLQEMLEFSESYLSDTITKDIFWFEKLIGKLKNSCE
ncbi:PadR family transcriptional regulator [Psychrobacillus insolitus]|uniref:PadR family transcriptional regulator n=1 Tax=Psychrobacillus insolitus TaxID=1461 RepID=A0A2W7MHV8_9BACI|nr:PadR family transcriptional regulator [Psychrobacillus insolitus]PZX04851.1 PadR family transcriptional regulator [Psychrobacillus insolitus]